MNYFNSRVKTKTKAYILDSKHTNWICLSRSGARTGCSKDGMRATNTPTRTDVEKTIDSLQISSKEGTRLSGLVTSPPSHQQGGPPVSGMTYRRTSHDTKTSNKTRTTPELNLTYKLRLFP